MVSDWWPRNAVFAFFIQIVFSFYVKPLAPCHGLFSFSTMSHFTTGCGGWAEAANFVAKLRIWLHLPGRFAANYTNS